MVPRTHTLKLKKICRDVQKIESGNDAIADANTDAYAYTDTDADIHIDREAGTDANADTNINA